MEFEEQNINDKNDNSFKNAFLIIIILSFSYLIERRFPDSIIKNIYFFLAFIIIIGFMLNYFFQNFFDKFSQFIQPIIEKIPFFSFEKMKEDSNKKNLEKIKEVYKFGYFHNQKNNNINNYNALIQNDNTSQPNYYHIKEKNKIEKKYKKLNYIIFLYLIKFDNIFYCKYNTKRIIKREEI